jgi:hypothetical protein
MGSPNRVIYASPKAGSNAIDAVGANTRIVNLGTGDVRFNAIINGPVTYTPFNSSIQNDSAGMSQNYLTSLGPNGSFGTYPQGLYQVTHQEPSDPYPITDQPNPALAYSNSGIPDNRYTVMNGRTWSDTWWNLSGHTTGNEMDRFVPVNGGSAGQPVLSKTVNVSQNTKYLLNAWVCNITKDTGWYGADRPGYPPEYQHDPAKPQFRLVVTSNNTDGTTTQLYNNNLGQSLARHLDVPEWKQVGDIIQTRANTKSLLVQIISSASDNYGNDYAIDDIGLWSFPTTAGATTPPTSTSGVTQVKTINGASSATVKQGDTVTYRINITNTLT